MDTIEGMYSIGQYIYTAKEISGWFDHSIKTTIPINTIGRIIGYVKVGKNIDLVLYEVALGKDFGHINIRHNDLKLG